MTDQITEPKADHDACAAVGQTVEAHKKLEAFVGTFKAEVSMWMGPGDPHKSTGVMTNTMDLGGRYLHQTYTGDATEGPFPDFEGRGYWGYNTVQNRYEGFWIDTACTYMQNETGDVDESGTVWTMTSTMANPQTGEPMNKRSVVTFIDADHHRMEMFFEGPDGNACKVMQIEYTRA